MRVSAFVVAGALSVAAHAGAGPILWVSDSRGQLGRVDVASNLVLSRVEMGVVMTDIAFDPGGSLLGIDFESLYSINPSTGATTKIGAHGIPGGNALVFSSSGVLYGAGSNGTLYTIDTGSGIGTALPGSTGGASSGDLAFFGGDLYLSTGGSSETDTLRRLIPGVGNVSVGSLGVGDVFGLANGGNGILYGLSGLSIYSVNTTTGLATFLKDYGDQGLTPAWGSAFFDEAEPDPIPEPGTLLLVGSGLSALALRRRRKARTAR